MRSHCLPNYLLNRIIQILIAPRRISNSKLHKPVPFHSRSMMRREFSSNLFCPRSYIPELIPPNGIRAAFRAARISANSARMGRRFRGLFRSCGERMVIELITTEGHTKKVCLFVLEPDSSLILLLSYESQHGTHRLRSGYVLR